MQCINTMGSYTCRCRPGFTHENNKDSCVDINECDLYQPCNTSISTCINLPGRYYCQCLMSQTNDEQCVPRNICAEQNNLCGPHSECVVSSSNRYTCQVLEKKF
jgi:fibulin 1/2